MACRDDAPRPIAAARPKSLVSALDDLLFAPCSWFTLDRHNRRVPGVRPGSLEAALALIGSGPIATVVGRLRREACAVDIDAGGTVGDRLADLLMTWAASRDVWAFRRPSGGAQGRHHVFLVPGEHRELLLSYLDQLRAEFRLPPAMLDLRLHVRPLSAPHRSGAHSPPRGIRAALLGLRWLSPAEPPALKQPREQRLRGAPVSPKSTTPKIGKPSTRPAGPVSGPGPLTAAWQGYLDHGRDAPGLPRYTDRSTIERLATHALVIAGYEADAAWTRIEQSHPLAFVKARERGFLWWHRYVWSDAQNAAHTWQQTHPPAARRQPTPLPATLAARAELQQAWTTWGGRDQRHSIRVVAEALLDRMDRAGSTRVPCPERDLLLDTPLMSRKTIRAALGQLAAAGFGRREATFRPGGDGDEKSHVFILDQRFSLPSAGAVRQLPPPVSHPPGELTAPGLWRSLGLAARHTLLAVYAHPGRPARSLAAAAGVCTPSAPATPAQLRGLVARLQLLASLGLVDARQDGSWVPAPADALPARIAQLSKDEQEAVTNSVSAERDTYYSAPGSNRWRRQRDAALRQSARRDLVRQRNWWQALSDQDRVQRRSAARAAYRRTSIREQLGLKARLVERRQRLGVDEEIRRREWIRGQDAFAYAQRVSEQTEWYYGLSVLERPARVDAWEAHRRRFGLGVGLPSKMATDDGAAAEAPSSESQPPSTRHKQLMIPSVLSE